MDVIGDDVAAMAVGDVDAVVVCEVDAVAVDDVDAVAEFFGPEFDFSRDDTPDPIIETAAPVREAAAPVKTVPNIVLIVFVDVPVCDVVCTCAV